MKNMRLNMSKIWGVVGLLSIALGTAGLWALEPATGRLVTHLADASDAIEQGKQLYVTGKLAEAAAVWEKAAAEFEAKGDRLHQAESLTYLSLAYQNLGQLAAAEKASSQSLELLGYHATTWEEENRRPRAAAPGEPQPRERAAVLAEALNTQGGLMLLLGKAEAALEIWQQAETAYEMAGDRQGIIGSQINQAEALQTQGMYLRARKILETAREATANLPDEALKMDSLHSLGKVLSVVGATESALAALEQSLAIATRLGSTHDRGAILLSLGNAARIKGDDKTAASYYETAATEAEGTILAVEARLNAASLKLEGKEWSKVSADLAGIHRALEQLPPNRASVYARVNLAQVQMDLEQKAHQQKEKVNSENWNGTAQLLATAVVQAQQLGDDRAEAFALNQLGKIYELTGQWQPAKELTTQALVIAQQINASDISAKALWQLGRLHQQLGDRSAAIAAYQNAVTIVQSLRSDITAVNADIQFNFRDTVEPIYRQFVSLLLQPDANQKQVSQENLKLARQTIENLQLAELDNFFRDACVNVTTANIDELDPKAATIYPIILSDRLEVILSIPGQPLRHYTTNLTATAVADQIGSTIEAINLAFSKAQLLQAAAEIYDWLIRPAQADLAASGIETLVFVLDGELRNLPMAVLYDGQQYLVEKYRLALSPGLKLMAAPSLATQDLKLISAGLTEARQGFPPLPGVEEELLKIAQKAHSKILLNSQFTGAAVQDLVKDNSFEVIHFATHGQFSSKFDQTFLLTWDGVISITDLELLLASRAQRTGNPVELLVLSACETAAGDNRAALGLAGFAVRSGVGSTLATLWSVKDESTVRFMNEFYRQLAQFKVSKSEAVRQAQLQLLASEYNHPFFWAPFVLVGNWL